MLKLKKNFEGNLKSLGSEVDRTQYAAEVMSPEDYSFNIRNLSHKTHQ
jgi:hypothetical protein